MTDWVNEWVQEGQLWVWRYAEPNRSWRGWHFSADPLGCRSVRNLIDRMGGGDPCYRTLRLKPVTDAVLAMPNYGKKCAEQFPKLKIEFQPYHTDLTLVPNEGTLVLTIGDQRLRRLSSAFADVEVGNGDFEIRTSDSKRADRWMFWWPPVSTHIDL